MKALEKDRRRRYETANDFAADVMRYLTDQPVEACPPSAWYRFAKFARRNRVALVDGGLGVRRLGLGHRRQYLAGRPGDDGRAARQGCPVRETESRSLAQQRQGEAELQKQRAESLLARPRSSGAVPRNSGRGLRWVFFRSHRRPRRGGARPEAPRGDGKALVRGDRPRLENRLAAVLDGDGLVAFNPDGMLLALSSGESVQLWETATWRRRGTPLQHGPGTWVTGAVFSPDGFRIATLTHGGEVRLWGMSPPAVPAGGHFAMS